MMVQRIYTGTGDQGETGLFGGSRVAKSNLRVSAYGAVDELNAMIGWTLSQVREPVITERLPMLQPDLFAIGAHLATVVRPGARTPKLPPLPAPRIAELEQWIDDAEGELPELRAFVMPGGSSGGAALHVARTVCRRAERDVIRLARSSGDSGDFGDSGESGDSAHAGNSGDSAHAGSSGDSAHAGGSGDSAHSADSADAHGVDSSIIVYLNRVSDLLFVWARRENLHAGAEEEQWLPGSG
ncbi:MAG TPA: cob(I)yrinic acid a,c-diamide adenosyltransferase [Longimicrobiales bacterium]|nr:cob(I)yrinic acid a,c-diamide adenosyltransferase [Longimicrobiales bacterium]